MADSDRKVRLTQVDMWHDGEMRVIAEDPIHGSWVLLGSARTATAARKVAIRRLKRWIRTLEAHDA